MSITNDEFYEGVKRREGRLMTAEYRDLIKLYFLQDAAKSLTKTAQHFGENNSSISYVVNGGPRKHGRRKARKVKDFRDLPRAVKATTTKGAAEILTNQILRAVDEFVGNLKEEIKLEAKKELIKTLGE